MDPAHDLQIERLIAAPLATVWRCLSQPGHLARWWVPGPVRIEAMALEAKPGGRFAYEMVMPDGARVPMAMMILAAEPQRRLVFTDLMTEGFRPVAQPFFGFAAELALIPAPGGTLYRATARHARAEDAARHAEMGFQDGWGTVAAQLDRYACEQAEKDTP
jgi:uncharacterized protein YndB with AHSA1/START domain